MTDRSPQSNPQAVAGPDAIPLDESIGVVFERRVREYPDRIALVSAGESISYAELNQRANRVAWALRQRARDGDERVGLCLRPGAMQVTVLLGILKAGLTAVVIDPLGPEEGARTILEDTEARWLITDRATADAAAAVLPAGCELLLADELNGTPADRDPDWSTSSMATACIVFTSGTTGRPKGVVRTHRNLVWVARAGATEASVLQECRFCFVTGLHTGNGLNNLLRVLLIGGTALAFDLRSQGVDRLADWLTEQRATLFTAPASVFRQFLRGLDAGRRFPNVGIVRLSSEKVLKGDFEGFRRHFPESCLFINTISSTETGSFASLRWAHSAEFPTDQVPIGHALPEVDLRLVDEAGQEVGVDQPGEITVQSPGVALGYWRQPKLTARSFRRSTNPADGVRYHTGDLAIRQSDGSLLYVGRCDFRVKIRGLGVNLQGVETALSSHPEVLAAAVLVRDQDQGAPWLVAFVVPRSGRKPARAELRQHLRTLLPEAAVPAVFEFLDRLPLRSQGKIDRNALALRAVDRSQRVSTSVAPRTPLETTLADLWREVLGVESIGIDDDFFDLGGDSLLATRVIAWIQHSFGVRLEVRGLFEASTVAAMATLIAGTANATTTPSLPALVSLPKGPHLPLSFAQERMWFLAQLEPDSRVYHLPRLLRLRGNLDFIALERALKEIVRRHDALRTICVPIDGVPHGELLSPDRFQVRLEDLRAISDPERELEIRRRARDELHAPFDLARDLMIRARVLQVAEDEHFLVLTLHHIASDRWSAALFVREWSQLYAAFHQGRSSPLADPAIQYSDYADWQRRWLQGELLQRQLDYWKEELAGAPTLLELPVDLPRPAISSQRGATRELSLGPTLTRALQSLAHREGATPFMILLAAWQVLLSRLSGQEDVLVGAPIAGRNHKATEGLIGFFVNTLVLRSNLSGNPTFRTFLTQVRETTLGAYQHSDLPFEKLVQELLPDRSLSHAPLFQSMLALQNAPTSALVLSGIEVDRVELDRDTSMFDLTLSLGEHEGVLRGSLGYCTDLFQPETIDRWIEHFRRLLEGIVSDPDQRIAALPMLSAAERHQLLHEWSVGPLPPAGVSHTPPPEDRRPTNAPPPNLCDLLEAQLVRSPLAEALLFGAERLTYRELFEQADALAARLRSLGVHPDTLVGLCVERSIDMLVALLGILRAGGAYLPLDPSHPPARLAFILADARPRVLVTQEHLRAVLPDHTAHVVCLDSTNESAAEDVECLPAPALAPDGDSLAYVLYTSGSTGQPKGVQIPRSALVNFLLSMARQPGMGPEDRMLALTTLGFDIAGLELFLPLVTGGCVVIADRETASDGLKLARLIADSGVTILQATPATWRMLVDAGWSGDPTLRILCGGEALPRDLAEQLRSRCAELWNLYGPTETTIWSLAWQVQPGQPIVIGRPIANTQAYVLDAHRQPVPFGVAGELHLGGAGLARGYLNRPELTAERFIQHRFAEGATEVRLYRTGDRVRWRPDGQLEFLGRLDHQIKLRGFRIELAAIWSDVLGVKTVGLHDHFFELGGHSLLAMRVVAQVRDRFGIELSVRALFEAPSIAQLAARISLVLAGDSAIPQPPLRPVPREGILPLSFAQERLWFLDQLEGGSTNYHLTQALRLRGPLDPATLERALAEIIGRHEALRTTCVTVDGQPHAVVLDAGRFRLEHTSLTEIAEADLESEFRKQAAEETQRPFDLSRDLLLRARCFTLGDEDHLLVLTLHHIASDGWSMGIFARELSALYSAFSEARPSPLPAVALQPLDFAAWQRQWLQGLELERQLSYWRTQLADAPPVLELPTDFPRPAVARYRGGRREIVLAAELTRSIHTLSRREGATPFMVLLGAWQTLLARLSGQPDVSIGVPVAGRTRTETEAMIGFFANTLVLRTDLSGNPTFCECLKRVRETTLAAYAHQDLPFEKLVGELRPERSLSHAPLFQVAFTFQNTPEGTLSLPGIAIERVRLESATTQFDLTLSLGERDGRFQGELSYDSDLFEPGTLQRWIGHFQCLLQGIVTAPDRPIDDLPILTEAERAKLLTVWSQPTVGPLPPAGVSPTPPPEGRRPTTTHLHALFAAQVDRTPDAVALLCGDTSLSYRELHSRAIDLASILRSRGVGRGTAVALHLDRSIDFAVAVLAILHAGGCYVPLPVEYPLARLRFMLEDSRSLLVLSRGPLPEGLCPPGCQGLDLEGTGGPPIPPFMEHLDAHGMEEASTNPRIHAGSIHQDPGFVDSWIRGCHPLSSPGADPAYLLYTSGSTGQPKGVIVPHRAVARLVLGQSFADFGPSLRTLLLAPPAFDASTFEFWAPLLHGGTCVIFPHRDVDPETLELTLRTGRVNCLWLTASLFNQILDLRPTTLEGVAHILTGGEALSVPHILRARELLPHTRLTNGYGPTECTTFACTHAIGPDEAFTHGSVPIGRPIAHTQTYVLDARRQPVPIGIPGELYLGGHGLALGYLGQPELTAERFVPDPFQPDSDSRLYRTGDRVRWRPDGTLEFLGRLDGQVKIRGFRVEPAEIERTLRRHPAVQEAWVLAGPAPDASKRLIAWCQTLPGSLVNAAELRGFLRQSLPESMVPAVTVSAERVPLTPNGKIDGVAVSLASDETSADAGPDSGTTTEAMMADLWCALLGLKRVGPDENFFDLGGHSLLSLQLLEQIHRVFQTRLTPRVFFENPTVRSLSARVWDETVRPGRSRNHSPDQRLVALQSGGTQPPIFVFPGGYGDESELITPAWMSRRHLGPDQPLYALLSPGVESSRPLNRTLTAEARDCLQEMRQVQPEGPWFLIGMCVGGNLAFEVARQAQEAGETVGMLALTDCGRPGTMGYLRSCLRDPRRGKRQFVMNWLYRSLPWARGGLTAVGRKRFWNSWSGGGKPPVNVANAASSGAPDKQWEWRAYQHGEAILARQLSRPRGRFRGRIDLVTSEQLQQDPGIHLWREQATQGTELLVLPGSHSTYLIEGAPMITQLCRQRIESGG